MKAKKRRCNKLSQLTFTARSTLGEGLHFTRTSESVVYYAQIQPGFSNFCDSQFKWVTLTFKGKHSFFSEEYAFTLRIYYTVGLYVHVHICVQRVGQL